ncbi:DUF3352 domain-containing protein [Streptomonospora litoralis]|nr:DUF3352 domain-containing protein [Streptomonospora litoralis]
MIPVAAGLGVVMMAGTVWASNSVVQNVLVGAQPESVLPASSIAFAKLDLRPSGGQLADYAQFVQRLPDTMREEIDPEADPAEELVDSLIENSGYEGMTYEEDFAPWLGQRFGFAVWTPENEEAADSSGTAAAIAIAAEDEDAAEQALSEMQSQSEDVAFDVRDDFAIVTDKAAVLSDLDAQIASGGTLDEQDTYTRDMESIGTDNIASAWMDLGEIAALAQEGSGSEYGGFEEYGGLNQTDPLDSLQSYGEVSGRMALGLRIRPEYLELRGDTLDVSVDGVSTADYEVPEPGLQLMGDLPDDTMMAVSGSGLADLAGQAYQDNPEDFAEFEGLMTDLGLTMPDGLTSLLGKRTAVGITDLGGSLDQFFGGAASPPSMQFRAEGADSGAVESAIAEMWRNSYTSPPGVSTEGSVTVATSGTTGTGRLGDDPVFKQTMAGTETAHLGMYLDLRPFAESGGESAPEQWGALGASVTFDASTVSTLARWAPNGGG